MKSTLFLTIFAAIAAAAPQSTLDALIKRESEPEFVRCGTRHRPKIKPAPGKPLPVQPDGPANWGCPSGDTCVGEYAFKDLPDGVCIKNPIKCGGTGAEPDKTCPKDKAYKCMPNPDQGKCPADASFCGFCVEKEIVDELGVRRDGKTNPCGGDSGKNCFGNPHGFEVCAGEDFFEKSGVCVRWGLTTPCNEDGTCFKSSDYCVSTTCPVGIDGTNCEKKICVSGDYAKELGLGTPKPPITLIPGGKARSTVAATPSSKAAFTKTITEKGYKTITKTITKTTVSYKTTVTTSTYTKTVTKAGGEVKGKPNKPKPKPSYDRGGSGYGGY
ncbi:hypothetical protein TWF281_005769 [Arthrobotrys megalospora]